MSEASLWWIAAGVLVALELTTLTFYLLMLALGAATGALAAHLGAPATGQMVVAAIVSTLAVLACHQWRKSRPRELPAGADPNLNMDVGETVQITAWNPDGTATVRYRGTTWTAMHRPGIAPRTGAHRVAELVGSRLLVDPV